MNRNFITIEQSQVGLLYYFIIPTNDDQIVYCFFEMDGCLVLRYTFVCFVCPVSIECLLSVYTNVYANKVACLCSPTPSTAAQITFYIFLFIGKKIANIDLQMSDIDLSTGLNSIIMEVMLMLLLYV